MKIAVAADHGGFSLREVVITILSENGYEVEDLGAYELDLSDDYPDFALSVASSIQSGRADRGIIICGSGIGATIVANKVTGIRAGTCHDTYSARQGVEHDDMNVICMGARVIGSEVAKEVVLAFVAATFSGEDRHMRRVEKIRKLE
tara:strand:+ start:1846 stop:2286 length:441 start_codon:yes stop_codon:yes gene_type:complete